MSTEFNRVWSTPPSDIGIQARAFETRIKRPGKLKLTVILLTQAGANLRSMNLPSASFPAAMPYQRHRPGSPR